MVLGLLTLAAIPTTIGVAEGVNPQKGETDPKTSSKIEAERMRKFNLECYCETKSRMAMEIDGGKVVLSGDKVYIDTQSSTKGHIFEGFYIGYPDPHRPQPLPLGLVSSISNDPPMLNWIYVDKDTREVKYGNRTQSKPHIVGSWGWDAGEEGGPGGVTLEGEEGAVAVETENGWEIRWEDKNGDIGVEGKRKLTVSLERKMLEPSEEEKQEQKTKATGAIKTDSNFTLTNITFQSNKKTTGEPVKAVRASIEEAKPKPKEPRLEFSSSTIEKPMEGK